MIVAFDLDGTLADITHRLHHLESHPQKGKNWPEFFRACVDDKPVWPLIEVLWGMESQSHTIEIWSGRSDIVRDETEEWLKRYAIKYSKLRMRKDGDYRPDDVLKAEWLEALPESQRPTLAFDDRQRIVDMWRGHGIICAQVAPGDF